MEQALALRDPAVVSDIDPFSREFLTDPYSFHEHLRDAGPVVWLSRYDVWAVTRYDQVNAVLTDWQTYCSGGGVGIGNFFKDGNWRAPSLLLETDPPTHTRARTVVGRVLSPGNLRKLRDGFYADAVAMVDRALEMGGFDAVPELAKRYPLKVFPDAVGVSPEERDNILVYGNMIFNTFGPKNEFWHAAMAPADTVIPWITQRCSREALRAGGLGAMLYDAADAGEVTPNEAALLVRSFLGAGVDTTVNALGNAILCFAQNPDQWRLLRADRTKIKAAFEEVMRYETPFQTFFRTTTKPVAVEGATMAAQDKVYVSVAAANRDPRRWSDPDRFDIARKAGGHVGFGAGIHGCVGQMIARLEVEMMLTAMAERVETIELTAQPKRVPHNTLRAVTSLPVRMTRTN